MTPDFDLPLGHAENLVPCTTWFDPNPGVSQADFDALKDEVRKLREEFWSLAHEQNNMTYDIQDLEDKIWNLDSRVPE